jgi:hypothetical protein
MKKQEYICPGPYDQARLEALAWNRPFDKEKWLAMNEKERKVWKEWYGLEKTKNILAYMAEAKTKWDALTDEERADILQAREDEENRKQEAFGVYMLDPKNAFKKPTGRLVWLEE